METVLSNLEQLTKLQVRIPSPVKDSFLVCKTYSFFHGLDVLTPIEQIN